MQVTADGLALLLLASLLVLVFFSFAAATRNCYVHYFCLAKPKPEIIEVGRLATVFPLSLAPLLLQNIFKETPTSVSHAFTAHSSDGEFGQPKRK